MITDVNHHYSCPGVVSTCVHTEFLTGTLCFQEKSTGSITKYKETTLNVCFCCVQATQWLQKCDHHGL